MRKLTISCITALVLTLNNANASGIPVVDGANLTQNLMNQIQNYTQMLTDYSQQILNYKQMLIDTINFEKQMQELGVGMNDINTIFGESLKTIESLKKAYDDINSLPDNFVKEIQKMERACNLFGLKFTEFNADLQKYQYLKKDIDKCLSALRNGELVQRDIKEWQNDMLKARDAEEMEKIKDKIRYVEEARAFAREQKTKENIQKITMQAEILESNDIEIQEKHIANQENMKKNFIKLMTEHEKGNKNTKQTQNLTNSILLQMLAMQQEQYKMLLQQAELQASVAEQDLLDITEEDVNRTRKTYKSSANRYSFTNDEVKVKAKKDRMGFPTWQIDPNPKK